MPRKRNGAPELERISFCSQGGEMEIPPKDGATALQTPLVSAERVRPTRVSEDATSTFAPIKRFLNRYFYFSMSLLLTALVAWGFSRTAMTISSTLPRRCPPALDSWRCILRVDGLLHRSVHFGSYPSSELASLLRLVWSRARCGDGSAGHCHRHHHGAV